MDPSQAEEQAPAKRVKVDTPAAAVATPLPVPPTHFEQEYLNAAPPTQPEVTGAAAAATSGISSLSGFAPSQAQYITARCAAPHCSLPHHP